MRSESEIREAATKLDALAKLTNDCGKSRVAVLIGAHCCALEWALGIENANTADVDVMLAKADEITSHTRN